jgi:hypothetical protein
VKIRFLADNDLRNSIRTGVLRHEPSVDFLSANAASLHGLSDLEVLRVAAAQNRLLVSHDENSMPAHFRDFITGNSSPGLLMVPQGAPAARVIESIVLIWIASESEEWIIASFGCRFEGASGTAGVPAHMRKSDHLK